METVLISWQQALPVRHQVLWPDKPAEFTKVTGDESALHYGIFMQKELVCVASVFLAGEQARLRKFATLPAYQGRGIGTQLITDIINDLKYRKIRYFWCDARTSARSFYRKFGFDCSGDEFFKSQIGFYKMALNLA